MRAVFSEQLDGVLDDLAEVSVQVQTAIRDATDALLGGDAELAEQVISQDAEVDAARERIEEQAFELLALQQPVATDLRLVVAALRMVGELERMGDLAVHVAKIARLRVPQIAVPEDMRPTVSRMAEVAHDMVGRLVRIIAERDAESALAFDRDDEEMDRLRRSTFTDLLGGDWPHGVEAAVDIALLGRYYERIADHAVSVAGRIVYVVTGQHPETLAEAP